MSPKKSDQGQGVGLPSGEEVARKRMCDKRTIVLALSVRLRPFSSLC